MWTLDSSSLPTTEPGPYQGGLLCCVDTGATYSGAPLATIDYGASLVGQTPSTVTGTGATISTTQGTVSAAITSAGIVFRPAVDISNPQPGEFVHNPFTGQVTLTTGAGFPLTTDQSVTLIGASLALQSETVSAVPAIARQLAVTLTSLKWDLSLEGQPSGQLVIGATNSTLPFVKAQLRHGTEFSIYGIGFRCGDMSISTKSPADYPAGDHTITISLGSKWENYLDEPYPWRNLGQLTGAGNTDGTTTAESVPATITLKEMTIALGADYEGPEITIQVPEDAKAGESTTLGTEFSDDWCRINASVADYSSANAIKMRPIATGRVWDYRGVTITSDAITQNYGQRNQPQPLLLTEDALLSRPLPGLPDAPVARPAFTLTEESGDGIVIEWENVQLTGDFSAENTATDEDEPTHANSTGRSKWVQRAREKTVSREGDEDYLSPPNGAIAVKSVSLNFDQSGPTKTFTLTTKEDGFITLVEQWRSGYALTGKGLADSGDAPITHWKVIEYTRKERLIDRDRTGYAYGWNTTGWRLARFKQENADNPETVGLETSDPTHQLYQFQTVPIYDIERQLLKQHRDRYDNLDVSDQQGEIEQITLPDGSTTSRYLRNPNFAEPMYVAASTRESVAFISTANPDGVDLPDLVSGQEQYNRTQKQIEPGRLRVFRSNGNAEQPGDRTPDRYTEYSVGFSAQDGNYSNSLEDTKFKDFEGRPGTADRLPPAYVQEQPPENNADGDTSEDESASKMYLLNSGAATQTLGQQLNYPAARTLAQGLTAARTDATLENLEIGTQETVEFPWNPDIRPGDQVIYLAFGEIRRRFVMSVGFNPTFNPDGTVNGTISLGLSRWVDAGAGLTLTTVDLPGSDNAADGDGEAALFVGNVFRKGFQLGEILGATVKSRVRGNY